MSDPRSTTFPTELTAGTFVSTPNGPGIVRNVVRVKGQTTTVLVELDAGPRGVWNPYALRVVTKLAELSDQKSGGWCEDCGAPAGHYHRADCVFLARVAAARSET